MNAFVFMVDVTRCLAMRSQSIVAVFRCLVWCGSAKGSSQVYMSAKLYLSSEERKSVNRGSMLLRCSSYLPNPHYLKSAVKSVNHLPMRSQY